MMQVRVFLSSANDMMKYREMAQHIIDEINQSIGEYFGVSVLLFRWEKNVIPDMGRPQSIIFDQSGFEDIDIFVGILGSRFGTPTGGLDNNNQEYGSGTQEEYERAYSNYQKNGKPHIMFFYNKASLKPGEFDVEQYQKVQEFLQKFNASSETPGLFQNFRNAPEFQRKFRLAITKSVLNIIDQKKVKSGASPVDLSEAYQLAGFQKMFIPETNSLRGTEKNKAIKDSSIVYLIAKTGNSFLGSIGNRYLDLLIKNVESGARVKILLLNPWTLDAIATAFTESGNIEMLRKLLQHDFSSQEIIEEYKKTKWFTGKLMDVIQEYDVIRKKNPQIELHFVDADVSASVLITDTMLFYEPYSNYSHNSRIKKITPTFEVAITNNNTLYSDSLQMFQLLWENSVSFDDLIEQIPEQMSRLANSIDSISIHNTAFFVGVHACVWKNDKFLILRRTETKTYMPGKWDLPGGTMEKGESIEETVTREVLEETGIRIKLGKPIYIFTNYVELPNRQTIQVIMEGKYLDGDVRLNPSEHVDSRWVTADEARAFPLINFLESYLGSLA